MKEGRMRSKKSCQYLHAKRRCLERYRLEITKSNYKQMVAMVQNENGTFVRSDSNQISIWIITFKGIEMKVAYDCHRHSIATFLPFDPAQDKPIDAKPQQI
jgi:hypothetical protein